MTYSNVHVTVAEVARKAHKKANEEARRALEVQQGAQQDAIDAQNRQRGTLAMAEKAMREEAETAAVNTAVRLASLEHQLLAASSRRLRRTRLAAAIARWDSECHRSRGIRANALARMGMRSSMAVFRAWRGLRRRSMLRQRLAQLINQ